MKTPIATLSLLALAACGNKNEDSGASDLSPTEGEWTESAPTVGTDTCGVADELGRYAAGGTVTLAMSSASTFTITDPQEEVDTCSLSGMSFACDTQSTSDDTPSDFGLNATIQVASTTTGAFSDADTMTSETVVEMGCEGPDCAAIEAQLGASFPCELSLTRDATAGT